MFNVGDEVIVLDTAYEIGPKAGRLARGKAGVVVEADHADEVYKVFILGLGNMYFKGEELVAGGV